MFKLAGILLLMAGCAGLGFERVAEEKRRINELREMRRMIVRMQDEMLYGKRTLPEICLLFGQCMKEPYRSAFAGLYEKLEENDGRDLTMLWETIQAAGIGQSLDIITGHIASAQAEYENKSRVIMSISIMAGLFLIILLL